MKKEKSFNQPDQAALTESQTQSARPKSIFFRTDTITWEALMEASEKHGKTQAEILTSLILWFKNMPENDQLLVLMPGQHIAPLQLVIDLVAQLHAADHSFSLKRWVRSVEDHEELLAILERHGQIFRSGSSTNGIRSWTYYRLAYIWIDIAYECRAEAIRLFSAPRERDKESGPAAYELALQCLDRSRQYGSLSKYSTLAVARFNIACIESLRCQYILEQALVSNSGDLAVGKAELARLREAFQTSPSATISVKLFEMICASNRLDPLCLRVEKYRAEAVATLLSIREIGLKVASAERNEKGDLHLGWLLTSCEKDPDLAFVRDSKDSMDQVFSFIDQLRAHGDTILSWCRNKLAEHLYDDVMDSAFVDAHQIR